MAAVVNLGGIQFGGSSNQVGVYNGQNMQNGWDSNSPNASVLGPLMGQWSFQWAGAAPFLNVMPGGQPTFDNDIKNNASPL
jgi:hypothetical protein